MTSERWQQAKTISDRALELDSAAREEFLRDRCGDDEELRTVVESLLASDRQAAAAAGAESPRNIVLSAAAFDQSTPILKDRYEIVRELGRGGMSVVYLARDRQLLAKPVVVKVLRESSNLDPWIRQKFLQEMEALSRIDHPGVVGVLDTGVTAEGQQFLVMQYIEGATLRGAIQAGGMNFVRAAVLIRQIGQALAAAHEKGVWHRDLKPENIMLQQLGGEEHVKLIDFGIAGIQNSQFSGVNTKVAGSLTYMAPEQFAGHPSAASDTYALGVVAYEILTGNKTFSPDSMTHLVSETKAQPEPPRELRPELPEAAEKSMLKALSFRAEHRHASVREFSEELYHALTGTEPVRRLASGTIEIAHVLFTGLVDYSLLPGEQQKAYLAELHRVVRESPQFRAASAAGDVINAAVADGIGAAFFGDPTAPAQCALEVAAKLKNSPHLKWRMGIHSGPAYRDVNRNANLVSGGINMGRRVMEYGDAGHILVSKSAAELLLQFSQWQPYLTAIGEGTTKDGVRLQLSNLVTAETGNREPPRTLRRKVQKVRSTALIAVALALVLTAAAAGVFWTVRGGRSQVEASIAVLPFRDISPEKNQEFFSEGLAEEMLNALTKIKGLRVAGRSSSFQFSATAQDTRLIGEKLHVASILEGSVRQQNNQARINVELIQAANGFQLWSETYTTELNDILGVQERIARAVSGALRVKLMGENATPPLSKGTNGEAFNQYLQGRYFYRRHNREGFEKAAGYFQQAIQLDPGYALAWVGLGETRRVQAGAAYIPVEEGYRNAREAVQRALALNGDLAEAHSALAYIQVYWDWDWAGAEASYKRALALEPRNASVIRGAGTLARILGRSEEAIARYRQAVDLDPLSSDAYGSLAIGLLYAGRYQDAKAAIKKALELTQDMAIAHSTLGQIYLEQSQPREALAEMQLEQTPGFRECGLAMAYYALGRKTESDASLAELVQKYQKDSQYQLAEAYAFRGEADQAFAWLDRAYKERDPGLAEMKVDPLLKRLHSDPRYAAMLKKLRL